MLLFEPDYLAELERDLPRLPTSLVLRVGRRLGIELARRGSYTPLHLEAGLRMHGVTVPATVLS